MQEPQTGGFRTNEGDDVLDPCQCIAKKNRKYATECTEAHLSGKGAVELSENFRHFVSLEVVWFNGNRLSRLNNLEYNFRIREVYVQDNRLVSLAGIQRLKFLRVLMASNNQLRNLDKQLTLFERFAFLKKLDLFDNPVAEEPDYRLRLIYQVPQVDILDRRSVKGPERLKADEVVPNLDKVSAPQPEKGRRKGRQLSIVEKDCFDAAKSIKEQRQKAEDEALGQAFAKTVEHAHARQGCFNHEKLRNREAWGASMAPPADARTRLIREQTSPTPWEKTVMRTQIKKIAGKEDLTADDVTRLAKALAHDGVDEASDGTLKAQPGAPSTLAAEVGRVLGNPNVLPVGGAATSVASSGAKAASSAHPFEKLILDPAATAPVGQVAEWLLAMDWPRPDAARLETRARQHEEDHKWLNLRQNYEALATAHRATLDGCAAALRLEGGKTCGHAVVVASESGGPPRRGLSLGATGGEGAGGSGIRKHRSDIFPQTFLRAKRQVCEKKGKVVIQVEKSHDHTYLGCG
jgi:hypothetical protein